MEITIWYDKDECWQDLLASNVDMVNSIFGRRKANNKLGLVTLSLANGQSLATYELVLHKSL